VACISELLANILELNQSSREKFDNIIILGVWIHNSKPIYDKFFERAYAQLADLKNKKIKIDNKTIMIRCHSGLYDLPAKAMICNVKQFNGEFGCISCFHPGKQIGRIRIYPCDNFYLPKTNDDYLNYSKIADEINKNEKDEKKHKSFFGFFGASPINKVLNIPGQIPFDYMHLVLQGHSKFLLNVNNLFFNSNIFEDQKKVGESLFYVNKILSSIKMPHFINRKATNIELSAKWKSSEIKNFLFYQLLPVFINILPSWYFYRLAAYVIAVRILYEPIKSNKDLENAEEIIKQYIKSLDDTFNEYSYSYTVHAHLHLADQVRTHGPLQCHSQFCFEGALFNLKKMLHGTKGFVNQISNQIFIYKQLPTLITQHKFNNNFLGEFVCKKMNVITSKKQGLIGTIKKKNFSCEIKNILEDNFNLKCHEAVISDRIFLNNKTFHSLSYSRRGETNSYSISYKTNDEIKYADIEYFLEINNKFYALINIHNVITNSVLPESTGYFYDIVRKYFSNFFKVIQFSSDYEVIDCECILNKCIIINSTNDIFLTELKYEFEHD